MIESVSILRNGLNGDRAVLAARQRRTNCPWVFAFPCSEPVSVDKAWNAVRPAAGLGTLRIHDLWHSFATVAFGGGEGLRVVAGRLLGHRGATKTNRFAHLDDVTLSQAAERVTVTFQWKLRCAVRSDQSILQTAQTREHLRIYLGYKL